MTIYDAEPWEVSILKKQLANLSCKCSACEKRSVSQSLTEEYNKYDKEVQEEQFTDSYSGLLGKNYNSNNTNVEFLCNNVSCAGCYIALNLLKARQTKIFKDQETETKSGLSCCDKSIGKFVRFVERTTSTSNMAQSEFTNFNVNVCVNNTDVSGVMKKRSNDHVTFSHDQDVPSSDIIAFHGNCFCLQNFMDSIRPPLDN